MSEGMESTGVMIFFIRMLLNNVMGQFWSMANVL